MNEHIRTSLIYNLYNNLLTVTNITQTLPMNSLDLKLSESEIYSLNFEELMRYADQFDAHWKIKILKLYSKKYPSLKTELITEAWRVAKDKGILNIYKELTVELGISPDLYHSTYSDIYKISVYHKKMRFSQEEAVRQAKSVGVPNNYRRYLYELCLLDEKIGDYQKCIDSLKIAFTQSQPDIRPHIIYLKLIYMYLLMDQYTELQEFRVATKNEKWRVDRNRSQKIERSMIKFLSYLKTNNTDRFIQLALTEFDTAMYTNEIFILKPEEVMKIFILVLMTTIRIKDIKACQHMLKNLDPKVQSRYFLSELITLLGDCDYSNFFKIFKKLAPHIYHDIFLYDIADKIFDGIISNIIQRALNPYNSIYFESITNILPFSLDTILYYLNKSSDPAKFTIDYEKKVIYKLVLPEDKFYFTDSYTATTS